MREKHLSYKESVKQRKAPLFGSGLKIPTIREGYVVNLFVCESDLIAK